MSCSCTIGHGLGEIMPDRTSPHCKLVAGWEGCLLVSAVCGEVCFTLGYKYLLSVEVLFSFAAKWLFFSLAHKSLFMWQKTLILFSCIEISNVSNIGGTW